MSDIKLDLFEYKRGELWGSALPTTEEDMNELVEAGIDYVISFEERFGLPDFDDYDIEHYSIVIQDFSIPSDENVVEFIRVVDRALKRGKSVLVHCLGGCGRTGTMLALAEIYLYGENDGLAAIRKVRTVRPCAIETDGQEAMILEHARNPLKKLSGFRRH
ncbi:MAG: protein-tyrosine phosphatase family protein [Promethearchaeota archaeon]